MIYLMGYTPVVLITSIQGGQPQPITSNRVRQVLRNPAKEMEKHAGGSEHALHNTHVFTHPQEQRCCQHDLSLQAGT